MIRLLAILMALGASAGVRAQQVVQPTDAKWTLMLGAFLPAFETKLRVDNEQLGNGSNVNLRDDLGVDQEQSGGWFGVEWRFAPRHRVGATISRFTLRGERSLQRDLQIGDEVYPAGAQVSSQLRLQIIPVTYSYSILKRSQDELALTAGLHWTRVTFNAEGSLSLGAQDVSRDASAKANVPLPLLGVRYDHHFSERWSVGANASVFALKFGQDTTHVEGYLWSLRLHGEYRFARNFAIGAALDGFNVDIDASQNNWKGGLEYGYWGPQLYLTARF